MSASTAPAAAPEPNNTPSTTAGTTPQNTPAPGLLTSMLAPVAPARTAAFSLDPQPADGTPATGAALPTEGVSSNRFHGDNGDQQDTNSTGTDTKTGQQPKGVVRAWLLAGAARWARGGGTQNKRLDMKKARAMAHQVKEARTVNSGAAGTGGGRGSNASGAAGGKPPKGNSRSTGGSAPKGPKNSTGSSSGAGRSPSGRDTNRSTDRSGSGTKPGAGGAGKGERGSSGGGSVGAKGNTAPGPKPGVDGRSQSPKPPKNDTRTSTPKNSTDTKGTTAEGGKSGVQGAAGTSGKNGAGSNSGSSYKPGKPTSTQKDTKLPAGKDGDSSGTKGETTGTDTAGKPPKHSLIKKKDQPGTAPTTPDKKSTKAPDKTTEPAKTNTPTDTKDAKPPTGIADKADGERKPTVPAPTGSSGKPFTTRPARQIGYRDGTRAARGTAHVKAYRDGIKDGYTDTIEAAEREKAHLDKAHTDRKTARQETQVPLATSADHHPTTDDAIPIPVDSVSSTHILLGKGAHRPSMTRGEVRSVKAFERRLEERVRTLTSQAEQTRGLKAHAEKQAADAMRLYEAARSVKGGDKYLSTLAKLQEAAKAQAATAEGIYTESVRGADQCRAALAGVQARYGGIYQAVVDSPETSPAEFTFYQG